MKEITKEDKINWAIHNVELEGYTVNELTKSIVNRFANDELTLDECIQIGLKRFKSDADE